MSVIVRTAGIGRTKKEKIENQLNIGIDDLNYKISKNDILKFY